MDALTKQKIDTVTNELHDQAGGRPEIRLLQLLQDIKDELVKLNAK